MLKNLKFIFWMLPASLFPITVTNNNDSGPGSLREAMTSANGSGQDIDFSISNTTITLASPLPAITNTYTIDASTNNITVSGNNAHRIFYVETSSPTISNLSLNNGLAKGGDSGISQRGGTGGGGLGAGGAVLVQTGAQVTLENLTFSNNRAQGGTAGTTQPGAPIAPATLVTGSGGGGLGGDGATANPFGNVTQFTPGVGGGGTFEGEDSTGFAGGGTTGGNGAGFPPVSAQPGQGFGGGGGAGAYIATSNSANGAAGAFGGGGGGGGNRGPFSSPGLGANGGFGGGGGGSGNAGAAAGVGGFSGGNAAQGIGGRGGGGGALGGALFVSPNSTMELTITGSPFSGSSLTPGAGTNSGSAFGLDIFLASQGNLRVGVPTGQTATLTSNIQGDALNVGGSFEKIGDGILDVTGLTNTYNGQTIVSAGSLRYDNPSNNFGNIATVSINGGFLMPSSSSTYSDPLSIDADGGFNVPNGLSLTLTGALSGTASLQKTGLGTLTLGVGYGAFTSGFDVLAGTAIVNTSIGGTTTIFSQGRLQGTGTFGTIVNDGRIIPGNSLGTMIINGDYTQGPGGFIAFEMQDDGTSDLLQISGTANLAGTVDAIPLPGIYMVGTVYTILEAATIHGEFDQIIEDHPLDFVLFYSSTTANIILQLEQDQVVLPPFIDDLKGNAKAVGDAFFCPDFIPQNPDLLFVERQLLHLPTLEALSDALVKISAENMGALTRSEMESNLELASLIADGMHAFNRYYRTSCAEQEDLSPLNLWIQPFGYYYDQSRRDSLPGFRDRTFGLASGFDTLLWDHFVVGGGIGYAYSNLNWKQNRGDGDIHSIYAGPTLGYVSNRGYVNFICLGTRSFYDVDRKIRFPGIRRTAHHDHKSWDILTGLTGGMKFKAVSSFQENLFFMPEAKLYYLNIFESGYRESGADSLNLSVKNKHSAYLQPEVTVRMIKDMQFENFCLSPSIFVGWQGNILLTSGNYNFRFYKQETCEDNIAVKSYHSMVNQLILGIDLVGNYFQNVSFSIKYEANMGDNSSIQEGTARVDWLF